MRRFWIGVAGAVALTSLVAVPGVASAGTTTGVSKATSCADLIKGYQKVNQAGSGINFSDPKSLNTVFKQGAKILRGYANSGPSSLKTAFKHLAAAYDKFAKTDFSNPAALSQLSTLTTTYAKDLQKIAAYFAKQCNFTIPTAGSETIPSIPTGS
jgi:hypothetical protein